MWVAGFLGALSPANILWLMLGTGIGLLVGVLHVLGANFAVALMLPFTFGLTPESAMIFLCVIHSVTNYGDSIASAIPFRILSLSSSLDSTRIRFRNVREIFEKKVSMRLSHDPCLGVCT